MNQVFWQPVMWIKSFPLGSDCCNYFSYFALQLAMRVRVCAHSSWPFPPSSWYLFLFLCLCFVLLKLSRWVICLTSNYSSWFMSGVWKGCHFSSRKTSHWRSKRTRSLLCHPLCWCLWEDWHEKSDFRNSSPRGKLNAKIYENSKITL